MNLQETIKRILREEYGRKNILYRAVGLDEAIKSCETGHLVYYSRNPMSRDWEVIEYGLGSQASEMSEEEVEEYVNDLVSWKLKSKGVNLTSDLDNAKGYSDIVLEINLVGYDYAEFSDVHIFAKNPDDCKILSVYYNGKEYSKEQFLDITKSLQESVKRILREGKDIDIFGHNYNELLDNITSSDSGLMYTEPEELLNNKIKFLKKIKNKNSIKLIRVVFSKSKNKINIKKLGHHYVYNIDDFHEQMLDYLYYNAKRKDSSLDEDDVWVVEIETPTSNINYSETILTYSLHPNEDEITIKNSNNLKIINIFKYYE